MPTETEAIFQELEQIKAFFNDRLEEGLQPTKEEVERVKQSLTETQDEVKRLRLDRAGRIEDGRLRVTDGPYAGLDFLGLRIAREITKHLYDRDLVPLEKVQNIDIARRELRDSLTMDRLLHWEDNVKQRMKAAFGEGRFSAHQDFSQKVTQWRNAMAPFVLRAMDSTTSGSGDELVPTFEAAELWMDVNLDTLVLPIMPQATMPTNPFDIPTQLGDTNWFPTTENVQVTTTDLTTAKTTLTAYGLKTGVPFSDELEEDAIIATASEIRSNLVRNAAEIIDDVLLNADTTTTNNINADGATISSSTAGKAQWLLGFDGLVHLALVDNSANQSFDHTGGSVSSSMYNRLLRNLGKYAAGRRPGEVNFVADVNTAIATLGITELQTVDMAGSRATLSTGEIMSIYGVPLIRSEQMKLADNDGKVTDSGNSTDTGRVMCFNTSQWRVGFRRNIEIETDREPGKSQTTMYVSMRIALAQRVASRGTATHTGIAYNIGSVT